jgi:hypothetical protein
LRGEVPGQYSDQVRGGSESEAFTQEFRHMDQRTVAFSARILRKEDFLPRYVVVLAEHVSGRTKSFPADILLNGAGPFRRTIHPWGKGSDVFFFNVTALQCAQAGVETHDECVVTLIPLD